MIRAFTCAFAVVALAGCQQTPTNDAQVAEFWQLARGADASVLVPCSPPAVQGGEQANVRLAIEERRSGQTDRLAAAVKAMSDKGLIVPGEMTAVPECDATPQSTSDGYVAAMTRKLDAQQRVIERMEALSRTLTSR